MITGNDVKDETLLAEAMLLEASANPVIKKFLIKSANTLAIKIIKPLLDAVESTQGVVANLNEPFQSLINLAINENSSFLKRQFGLFREYDPDQIRSNPKFVLRIVKYLYGTLIHTNKLSSIFKVMRLIKAMTDACYCFEQAYPEAKGDKFKSIHAVVKLSTEEQHARITRHELGQGVKFSISSGIGIKEKEDLISEESASSNDAVFSGKATFFYVNFQKRAELHVKKFDEFKDEKSKEFLIKYRISLDSSSRQKLTPEEFTQFIKSHIKPSTIEKMAKLAMPSNPFPLLASVSSTTSRALSLLYFLNVFGEDENFDFDGLIITSNCLLAASIYGGHHTFLEAVESYNRFLDYLIIKFIDSKKYKLTHKCESLKFPTINILREERFSFFHLSYVQSLIHIIKERLSNVITISQESPNHGMRLAAR